jgi:hypothetical protein
MLPGGQGALVKDRRNRARLPVDWHYSRAWRARYGFFLGIPTPIRLRSSVVPSHNEFDLHHPRRAIDFRSKVVVISEPMPRLFFMRNLGDVQRLHAVTNLMLIRLVQRKLSVDTRILDPEYLYAPFSSFIDFIHRNFLVLSEVEKVSSLERSFSVVGHCASDGRVMGVPSPIA